MEVVPSLTLQRDLWFQGNFKKRSHPRLPANIMVSSTTGEEKIQPDDITSEDDHAFV